MVYEKKYPLTHVAGETLTLTWERGYKNTTLFYNGVELICVENVQKLKKGVKFEHETLGLIELTLNENPTGVDIIVNGYHSTVNKNHPEKKIKSINIYFIMFASFLSIYLIFMGANWTYNLTLFLLNYIFDFLFLALYIISAIFSAKGQLWAVYMGFCTYCFGTLLGILAIILGITSFNLFISIIVLAIRGGLLFLIIPYIKTAVSVGKHNALKRNNHSIIDQLS